MPLLCLLLEMERTPLPVSLVRKRERLKPCPLRSSSSRQSSRLSSLPFSSRWRKRLFTSFRERGRWLYPRLSSPAEGESTLPLPSCSQERRVQPCPLRSCSRESREKRERLSSGFYREETMTLHCVSFLKRRRELCSRLDRVESFTFCLLVEREETLVDFLL